MALHPDITRKDNVTLALDVAATAVMLATGQQTGNAGSATYHNADGSKTLTGPDAGPAGIAQWVGKTTPPNRPTGITAESHMGTVFIAWDGTLDGGMEPSFLLTRISIAYTDDSGDHSVDLGDLRGAGSVGTTTLVVGTVVTVTARAYDDAHDENGLSHPNVSAPSDPIRVTVLDEAKALRESVEKDIQSVSDKAAGAQKTADAANDANTRLRKDTEASLSTVNTTVAGVRNDVDRANTGLDAARKSIDAANTRITQTSDAVDGLTTTVSNVSKNADSALALSTQNHQDLTGFQQTATAKYETKDDSLSKFTQVNQKADALGVTLSTDYRKKTDADALYATKAALQATSSSISASVSETYATKDALQAVQNIADNAIEYWQGHGVPAMNGFPASDWKTDALKKQHAGDTYTDVDSGYSYRFIGDNGTYTWNRIADSDVTKALNAIAATQKDVDANKDAIGRINTSLPLTYAAKSDVKLTTDGLRTDVNRAITLGQQGIDDAASVDQKADGIQATVSQQATTIDRNVKAIAQVNLRADSLNTSITQVSDRTDLALANSAELVVNGGPTAAGPVYNGWTLNSTDNVYERTFPGGQDHVDFSWVDVPIKPATTERTYRISLDARLAGGSAAAGDYFGFGLHVDGWPTTTISPAVDWAHFSHDVTVPANASNTGPQLYMSSYMRSAGAKTVQVRNISCKDVTDVTAAQSDADTAISQSSQTQQDLNGFKASVNQTYETKTDSTAKATTAQQNLDGFKASVQQTYLDKTDARNTYSTKAEVRATTDQISANLTSVGNTADSAMSKATSAQQSLDGFKASVQQEYATKSAVSDVDAKASSAGDDASLALRNGVEAVINGGFDSGFNHWNPNNTYVELASLSGRGNVLHVKKILGGSPYISQNDIGQVISKSNRDRTIKVSWDYMLNSSFANASTTFGITLRTSPAGSWIGERTFTIAKSPIGAWRHFETTYSLPSGQTLDQFWFISRNGTTGDAVDLYVDNVSCRDITEVTDLQSDVAATYATQSSVSLTASQIRSDVSSTYATKSDVSSKYTSLTQADDAFDARIGTAQSTGANAATAAANAQSRAGVLETLIHSDANGVRVGRTVNGKYQGYSALVNANGSFDTIDSSGNTVSRVDKDGMELIDPSSGSLTNVTGMVFGSYSYHSDTDLSLRAGTNIGSYGGQTGWRDFESFKDPSGGYMTFSSPTGRFFIIARMWNPDIPAASDWSSVLGNVNFTTSPHGQLDTGLATVWNFGNQGPTFTPASQYAPCFSYSQFGVAILTPNKPYYVSISGSAFVSKNGAYGHIKGVDVFVMPI